MAYCICHGCGRHMDCGGEELCELCEADKPAITRMLAADHAPTSTFILIHDNKYVVNTVICQGWEAAKKHFHPAPGETIALVLKGIGI